MIALATMLVGPAEDAGIEVPPELKNESGKEEWDAEKYPRFTLFASAQLGQPMPSPTSHWDNAKVIAAIPEAKLKKITMKQLISRGFEVGCSVP
jgi:hypothetical protein